MGSERVHRVTRLLLMVEALDVVLLLRNTLLRVVRLRVALQVEQSRA
jgi:hypothetical protein